MLNITLKDGAVLKVEEGKTALDVARMLSEGLARVALAAEIDGEAKDLSTKLIKDCSLNILTFDSDKGKKALRHTASHVLAQAVKRLYPNVRLAIGPAIENGFYYDFDAETAFSPEDLEAIEAEMKKIVKENLTLERFELSREEALGRMKDEPYKVELIRDLPVDATISFYRQGDFVDLCAGPHIPETGKIKALKLTSVTGAYWRGDSKNKMLQRIYGTAFLKNAELEAPSRGDRGGKAPRPQKARPRARPVRADGRGPGLPVLLPEGNGDPKRA